MSLDVHKPGSRIKFNNSGKDEIEATITAVCIRGDSRTVYVTYEVIWWNGRTREEKWVTEHELWSVASHGKVSIGFNGESK